MEIIRKQRWSTIHFQISWRSLDLKLLVCNYLVRRSLSFTIVIDKITPGPKALWTYAWFTIIVNNKTRNYFFAIIFLRSIKLKKIMHFLCKNRKKINRARASQLCNNEPILMKFTLFILLGLESLVINYTDIHYHHLGASHQKFQN